MVVLWCSLPCLTRQCNAIVLFCDLKYAPPTSDKPVCGLTIDPPTFVHAVVPVGVGSELLDGLTAQQTRVGGLGPQGEGRAADVLAVALLAVLQTLVTQHNNTLEDMNSIL